MCRGCTFVSPAYFVPDGSAIVGHHDRAGLQPSRHMNSWNSSPSTRGRSQERSRAAAAAA
jgi:hypothetical protein